MFRRANETYDEFQKRMERRADILFPTMRDKDKVKKLKNLPLGKSIYDEADFSRVESVAGSELDKVKAVTTTGKAVGVTGSRERKSKIDDDDDYLDIKHTHKVKSGLRAESAGLARSKTETRLTHAKQDSELDALTDDKYNKSLSSKNEDKQPERKSRKDRTPEEDEEILDLMYPSMKNIKNKKDDLKIPEISEKDDNITESDKDKKKTNNLKKGNYTGGAADIEKSKIDNDENKSLLLKGSVSHEELKTNDTKFKNSMDVVFENEGGFSNRKNDKGGRTNLGITQKTYNDYCKRHNIETKDVKNLSKGEAVKVYYDDYWKASGADKIENPTEALILFDTAVLHGVGRAKQFYKQADGNFDKILQLRKDFYKKKVQEDSSQEEFLNGWNKRVDKLEKKLKQSRNN